MFFKCFKNVFAWNKLELASFAIKLMIKILDVNEKHSGEN
jgi:hypothetical protein